MLREVAKVFAKRLRIIVTKNRVIYSSVLTFLHNERPSARATNRSEFRRKRRRFPAGPFSGWPLATDIHLSKQKNDGGQ